MTCRPKARCSSWRNADDVYMTMAKRTKQFLWSDCWVLGETWPAFVREAIVNGLGSGETLWLAGGVYEKPLRAFLRELRTHVPDLQLLECPHDQTMPCAMCITQWAESLQSPGSRAILFGFSPSEGLEVYLEWMKWVSPDSGEVLAGALSRAVNHAVGFTNTRGVPQVGYFQG